MIKVTATALIRYISPVIEIPSKTGGQSFLKRDLILDDSWSKDGTSHPNFVQIEFSGDKIAQLDNFIQGQQVTVEACVNGREYNGRFYTSLRGLSVSLYEPQQAPAYATAPTHPTQAAPAAQPASAPYPQQPQYPQATPAYPQAAPAYPSQPTQYPAPGSNCGPGGLPF